uniref:Uncharacterized protein n=1 Tax=Vespula pensylvanica TaxID=30213 RepID=A0A834P2L7_VESPE|nr:hypothetical protein H0235_008139 [Vespula pensylvanica]
MNVFLMNKAKFLDLQSYPSSIENRAKFAGPPNYKTTRGPPARNRAQLIPTFKSRSLDEYWVYHSNQSGHLDRLHRKRTKLDGGYARRNGFNLSTDETSRESLRAIPI